MTAMHDLVFDRNFNIDGAKEEMRDLIAWSHDLRESSRSFDYSQIRVQTSPSASAAVPVENAILRKTQIIRIMRDLEPAQAAWLRYCYADRDEPQKVFGDITTVSVQLWKAHIAGLETELTEKKARRLQGFVLPALQQIREELRTEKCLYTTAKLLELTANSVGANQNNWTRDWAPHWRSFCAFLRDLDHVALLQLVVIYDNDKHRKNGFTVKRNYGKTA